MALCLQLHEVIKIEVINMSLNSMWMNKPGTGIKQCHQNVIKMSLNHHQNIIKIKSPKF